MKLQELHEGAGQSTAEKITKALSGIKGTKVSTQIADYDDLDGNELIQAYLVKVTYTPSRGVKPTETIKVYKTTDGDWEYLSDSGNSGNENMADTLADLRKEIEVAQKFHGKSSKVDESVRSKLFKAFWETTPKEIMRRQQEYSDEDVLMLYGKGLDDSGKGSPRNIQMRALADIIKKRGLKVTEGVLNEGYEAKILDALKKLKSCYFENGTLWCDEAEYDEAKEILKAGVKAGKWAMPKLIPEPDLNKEKFERR